MKSRIALLITGIALGLLITRLFDRTSTPAKPPIETQQDNTDTPIVTQKEFKIGPDKHTEITRSAPKQEQPTAAPAPKQLEKTYGVRIEESTVRDLEAEKEFLRQHAFAELRDDGWQIHILEQDKALLQTGLSDGDIITHESLNAQLQMSDRSALVTRFVALLRYIER